MISLLNAFENINDCILGKKTLIVFDDMTKENKREKNLQVKENLNE